MKKVLLFCLIFSLFSVQSGFSEPSETIKHLKNEPVSRFDWGMDRLHKGISQLIEITKDTPLFLDLEKDYNLLMTYPLLNYGNDKLFLGLNLIFQNEKEISQVNLENICLKFSNLLKTYFDENKIINSFYFNYSGNKPQIDVLWEDFNNEL